MIVSPRAIMDMEPLPDSVIDLFIATFAGRTNEYVENSAGTKHAELTRDVVREAHLHNYPISAFLGRTYEDGTIRTHICAVDFDGEDGVEQARLLVEWLVTQDIEPLVAKSRRGTHVWVLLGPTSDGYPPLVGEARRFLHNALVLACGKEVADSPTTEVFPKDKEGQGALRLPGMPHPKTHERYAVTNCHGEVVKGMANMVLAIGMTDHARVKQIAGPPVGSGRVQRDPRKSRARTQDPDQSSATASLIALGVENARPGITVKCPKHEDRRKSLTIFKDDKRVYCGAPACPLHGDGHGVGSIMLARMVMEK